MSDIILIIVAALIGVGVLFSLLRLFIGPTLADRIISLDTVNVIIIGLIAFLAIIFDNNLYLDIALVYGILAFLETIVFSRYLEGKNHGNNQ